MSDRLVYEMVPISYTRQSYKTKTCFIYYNNKEFLFKICQQVNLWVHDFTDN